MEPIVMDSFYKHVVNFGIEGLVEEGKIDYVTEEHDSYLKSVQKFIREGLDLIHWNKLTPRFYIFHEEIHGPDSSGYPNCLLYNIGFPTLEEARDFTAWFRNLCKLF